MTGEATRILLMEQFIVRFPMAVGTLRNKAMIAFVAGNAG